MLLFLHGKNESIAFQKAKAWKDQILKEKNISDSIVFLEKNFEDQDFGTLATDVSIFGDISAYFIKLKKEEVLNERHVLDFVNSENIFVIFSNSKDLLDTVEQLKATKNIFIQKIEEEKTDFFPSHFVEALQKKDKKNSWKYFRELSTEKAGEEIYGVCIFAYKSLFAAATFSGNSSNSGVKDFSFNNAKRNLQYRKNTSTEEVENIYFNLLKLLPQSRQDNVNLNIALEKWILES